jgi:hypothetical protein
MFPLFEQESPRRRAMSITFPEILTFVWRQPWWVWPVGLFLVWFGAQWLYWKWIGHIERPVITPDGFRQCRVHVDFRDGTITLPRGDAYPVSRVRGLRWENVASGDAFMPMWTSMT